MRLALAIAALALGCRGEVSAPTATPTTEPPADALSRVTENGPVKATLQVWPAAPTLADELRVRLTVEAATGVRVEVPTQLDALGRFDVAEQRRDERSGDGKRIQIEELVLRPRASGPHRLPPLRLEVVDGRAGGSGSGAPAGPSELLTEELPIEIAPVPTTTLEQTLRPARAPLAEEVGARPLWQYIALGGAAFLAIVAVVLWRRGRARRVVRRQLSAYDAAVASLGRLEASGAPDVGTADAWFVELSDIVRRYLEGRYDIRAPELTTEEFLQAAARAPELTEAHRELLTAFLRRCDEVKFGGYRPDAEESLATLRAARGFVEDTRRQAPASPGTGAAA